MLSQIWIFCIWSVAEFILLNKNKWLFWKPIMDYTSSLMGWMQNSGHVLYRHTWEETFRGVIEFISDWVKAVLQANRKSTL